MKCDGCDGKGYIPSWSGRGRDNLQCGLCFGTGQRDDDTNPSSSDFNITVFLLAGLASTLYLYLTKTFEISTSVIAGLIIGGIVAALWKIALALVIVGSVLYFIFSFGMQKLTEISEEATKANQLQTNKNRSDSARQEGFFYYFDENVKCQVIDRKNSLIQQHDVFSIISKENPDKLYIIVSMSNLDKKSYNRGNRIYNYIVERQTKNYYKNNRSLSHISPVIRLDKKNENEPEGVFFYLNGERVAKLKSGLPHASTSDYKDFFEELRQLNPKYKPSAPSTYNPPQNSRQKPTTNRQHTPRKR